MKEQAIDELLVRTGNIIECMWQCKGDQKVVDRQQFLHLPVTPLVGTLIAALRAVAITAGVIAIEHLLTVVTIIDFASQSVCTTSSDVIQRLFVAFEYAVAVLLKIFRAVVPEYVS